jgi:hypothetical protein
MSSSFSVVSSMHDVMFLIAIAALYAASHALVLGLATLGAKR